jgi:hypothetical protein
MSETAKESAGDAFKLERYKFILQQLDSLNQNHHKYLTLFQTLITAVVTAGVALFVGWRELKLDPEVARIGLRGLFGLVLVLTVFLCFSILAGVFSWFDFRNEEVDLLIDEVGPEFRKRPTMKNLWRWPELYFLVLLVFVVAAIYWFLEYRVIPLIH